MIGPGATAHQSHLVSAADTAIAVGSGDLPVLGTPRLLAWCEGATCEAVDGSLGEGMTSVGTGVELHHVAASAVGRTVLVTATLVAVDGRRLRFEVVATHEGGESGEGAEVVGRGVIERVVVDADRFLSRRP